MPKLVHQLPKYALHKPTGQARVKFNGKVTYLGRFGSPESKELYAQFVASLGNPQVAKKAASAPSQNSNPLVGELVIQFYQHAEVYYRRNGKPTGEATTVRACLRPLTRRFGELPATEFGAKKLKQVREDMIQIGWARNTINKATSIIKRLFRWAGEEEIVPAEIAGAIWTVRGLEKHRSLAREKEPVVQVPDEIIDATLPHVSEIVADLIRIMRLTGSRPGEAINMTKTEIDMTDPECWVFSPRFHKTSHKGKERHIKIGPRAQAVLMPWIMKADPTGRIFPIRRDLLTQAIHRGCIRAFPHPTLSKVKKLTTAQKAELNAWIKAHKWAPNQVRHTYGTDVRAQFGAEASQCMLGHSKLDTTEIYAERDMRQAAEIARKIG
jgi:integrase